MQNDMLLVYNVKKYNTVRSVIDVDDVPMCAIINRVLCDVLRLWLRRRDRCHLSGSMLQKEMKVARIWISAARNADVSDREVDLTVPLHYNTPDSDHCAACGLMLVHTPHNEKE